MTRNDKITPPIRQRRPFWLGVALIAGVATGGVPTRAVAECAAGESLEMSDPVVTVIAGPGDAQTEQARWSNLDGAWILGNGDLALGDEILCFEAAP